MSRQDRQTVSRKYKLLFFLLQFVEFVRILFKLSFDKDQGSGAINSNLISDQFPVEFHLFLKLLPPKVWTKP